MYTFIVALSFYETGSEYVCFSRSRSYGTSQREWCRRHLHRLFGCIHNVLGNFLKTQSRNVLLESQTVTHYFSLLSSFGSVPFVHLGTRVFLSALV